MSTPLTAIAAIAALFFVLLAFKSATKLRFCVICASVSMTWAGLLAAYHLGYGGDLAVVALLMGQSVVGAYYLAERRLPERYRVFRLPFLLTATAAAAVLLGKLTDPLAALLLLAALWAAFGIVFAYRQDARIRTLAEQIVACCKNW